MRTVVLGRPPVEIEAWLERRRELGQDGFDEVWEGELHVAPMAHGRHGRIGPQLARILGPLADAALLYASDPLNIGRPDDYRVPDGAFLRTSSTELYNPTAAIIVEVLSPGDETRLKVDFYYRVGVEEMLIVDPEARAVEWLARAAHGLVPAEGSRLLGISATDLATAIAWPD